MFGKIKEKMANISFARNSYSAITGVVVIAIVLILNLILQQLAGTSLSIDISDNNLYEISDITTGLLDELDTEVTFTVLAQEDDIDPIIIKFIDKYTALSKNIVVEWIDPVLYPTALDSYNASYYDIVIACEATGKSTTVSISDIYYYDEMTYYYYGTLTYYFDGDGLFTSAINQVTSTEEQKMYTVSGHGEESLSTTITDLLTKSCVTTDGLDLLTATEIPEDCDLLAIIAPATDITEAEKDLISDYLASGGKVLIMLSGTATDVPNLSDLFTEYGLELADGYIYDQERAYQGNGYYIIPNVSVSGDMATDITTGSVLVVSTFGFTEITPERDTISVDSFMYTSENSYAISETEEVTGMFTLGAVSTETITLDDDTTTEARLTVYGSSNIILEDITSSFTSLENTTLFMNSVMANFDGSANVSIESKVIEDTYNAVDDTNTYSLIFIVILPLGVLIAGFIVWNDRRKQ